VIRGFGVALFALQRIRPGPHLGFGRSVLTVGIVFAALELLPQYVNASWLWTAAYQGWPFGALAALTGVRLALRGLRASRSGSVWGRHSLAGARD